MLPLYILGSSGFAREVAAYARLLAPERAVFFVDDYDQSGESLTAAQYVERLRGDGGESVLGAGRCEIRRKQLAELQPPFATIIHPAAVVMGEVAPGCVIAPGAVIAPNARLESHVVVNYNATVGHDTLIQRLSVVGPGSAVGGWCQLGEASYVGAGALIRERLHIGHDAIIGMGAVVTRDVSPEQVAVGVPARFHPKSESGKGWLK
jgi:hypothetical protein